MYRRILTGVIAVLLTAASANAQKPEFSITLNEPFLDALLDSVFKNFDPPQFSIAANSNAKRNPGLTAAFAPETTACTEAVQILRESNGVATAVRFRDGKISPLAFSGNYNPPFVGCVPFAGYAETNIELEFDQNAQRLIARAKVLNVSLNGTGGIGGSVIAKLVQSAIDKKINPIEIVRLDKLSFLLPVQNGENLRMKATGIRHEIDNGSLKILFPMSFLRGRATGPPPASVSNQFVCRSTKWYQLPIV